MAYECVVVAAGASSRMGAWKPLLPFGAGTVIGATVAAALAAGSRVVLVTGYRGDELAGLFAGEAAVRCVANPEWERGLLGSVLRGVRASSGARVFLMNGDKPLVKPETYVLLAAEADRRLAAGLPDLPLFPAFGGKAGHPVLIPRGIALGASALPPDARMRDHLAAHSPILIDCADEGVLLDIDTPEDYERLRGSVS